MNFKNANFKTNKKRRNLRYSLILLGFSSIATLAYPNLAICEPRVKITGDANSDLLPILTRAAGEVDNPPRSAFEARRRAETAANYINEALRSEGYYSPTIEILIGEDDVTKPVINITTGPQYKIKQPEIIWDGFEPDISTKNTAIASIGLNTDSAGRAEDILSAESRVLGAVLQNGYADAQVEPRRVIVDHADNSVHPIYKIKSGGKILMGEVVLTGQPKTRNSWVQAIVPWRAGADYDPQQVAELERRLRDTGVYDTIAISLGETNLATGQRPVNLTLVDRPRISVQTELGYATTEGISIEGEVARYNMFRRADTLIGRLTYGEIKKKVEGEIRLPHYRAPNQTLAASIFAVDDNTEAYLERGIGLRAELTRKFETNSFWTYGTNFELSRNSEPSFLNPTTGINRDFYAFSAIGAITIDRTDNPLNARRGFKADARIEPTIITGDANLTFVKLVTQASYYYDFSDDGASVVAMRARVGSLLGGSIPDLPSGQRLYAGGGGSVRGYEYQGIGPRYNDPNRTPVGGLSLVETSIEYRQKISDKFGVVAFVDSGTLGLSSTPSFKEFRAAAGIGVRYDLGFAPVRLDIAVPMHRPAGDAQFQIYIGVGQSF